MTKKSNDLTPDQQTSRCRSREKRVAAATAAAREPRRPEQNVAYDEVVKGRPLTDEERRRAERESPLRK